MGLEFAIVGNYRSELRGGYYRPARGLPAKTPLKFALSWSLREPVTTAWQDEADRPLETRLAEIAADLIVAGEATFREGLVEARERADEYQRWLAERARERQEALDREGLKHLEMSGSLLRQAEDLRALIGRVSEAVAVGQIALDETELAEWRAWALARADTLDPVLSGQVLSHLRPPQAEPDR